jgi:hypothetical protein
LVGVLVGELVGVLVGVSVGVLVGVSVGVFVGVSVGVSVGVCVGVFVGVGVSAKTGLWIRKTIERTVNALRLSPRAEWGKIDNPRRYSVEICSKVAETSCAASALEESVIVVSTVTRYTSSLRSDSDPCGFCGLAGGFLNIDKPIFGA